MAIILCCFRSTGLWRLAQGADFTEEELESIRIELKHYEQRIKKMQHLEAELKLVFFFIPYFSGEAQIWVLNNPSRTNFAELTFYIFGLKIGLCFCVKVL